MNLTDIDTSQPFSIDTRNMQPGSVFVAIKGENFDGHDYVATAAEKGAVAAIVSREVSCSIPLIKVENTVLALGELAVRHRNQFNIPVIALTGSCGKTSTKNMLASICRMSGEVLATRGNFNNDIGMPLTLLGLNHSHDYAVLEMGANHHGEIAYITKLARPTVALITNVGAAHLAGFNDVAGVAKAKSEIFQGLLTDGVAVINADDAYASYWRSMIEQKVITFGLQQQASVTARDIVYNDKGCASFVLVMPDAAEVKVTLQVPGEHNILNALAAAAATSAVGISVNAIAAGLVATLPENMRLVMHAGYAGSRIIDDTYNANPISTRAAIQVLQRAPGEKILVLGDMYELGEREKELHAEIGQYARKLGVDKLFVCGKLAMCAAEAFGANALAFASHEALASALREVLTSTSTVLVKGSRGAHMELVVQQLIG